MKEETIPNRLVKESKLGIEDKLNNTTNSISGKIISVYNVDPRTNRSYEAVKTFFGEQEAVYNTLRDHLPAGSDASSFRFLYASYIAVDRALNSFRILSTHNPSASRDYIPGDYIPRDHIPRDSSQPAPPSTGGNGFGSSQINFSQVYPRSQDDMLTALSNALSTAHTKKHGYDLESLTKNYFEWIKHEVDGAKSTEEWSLYMKYLNDLAIKFEGETRIYTGFCTASYAPAKGKDAKTGLAGLSAGLSFDDIGGYEEVKEQLREIIFCIKNKEKMIKYIPEDLLLPKGVLLVGPPGTGKTFFAEVFSYEAGVPFISFGVEDIGSEYQYKTSKNLEEKFKEAAYFVQEGGHKACIIFIDEIEAITATRYDSRDNNDAAKVVNTLNVYMDGGKATPGVIIFAATNREDVMDRAIVRPGRFSKKIHIGYPNDEELNSIFMVYVNKYNKYSEAPIFSGINYQKLVEYCSNKEIIRQVTEGELSFSEKGITGAVINETFAEMVRLHIRGCFMKKKPVIPLSTEQVLEHFRKYRERI